MDASTDADADRARRRVPLVVLHARRRVSPRRPLRELGGGALRPEPLARGRQSSRTAGGLFSRRRHLVGFFRRRLVVRCRRFVLRLLLAQILLLVRILLLPAFAREPRLELGPVARAHRPRRRFQRIGISLVPPALAPVLALEREELAHERGDLRAVERLEEVPAHRRPRGGRRRPVRRRRRERRRRRRRGTRRRGSLERRCHRLRAGSSGSGGGRGTAARRRRRDRGGARASPLRLAERARGGRGRAAADSRPDAEPGRGPGRRRRGLGLGFREAVLERRVVPPSHRRELQVRVLVRRVRRERPREVRRVQRAEVRLAIPPPRRRVLLARPVLALVPLLVFLRAYERRWRGR